MNLIDHINKGQNPQDYLNRCREKPLIKFNSFMLKTLNKLGTEGNIFKLIRPSPKNPQSTSHLMAKDQILSPLG